MNKLLMLIVATMLLNACASQPASHTALVSSLAVGVQARVDTLRHMADALFPAQGLQHTRPSSLEYVSGKALQDGLATGSYDMVLGLLETFATQSNSQSNSDRHMVILKPLHLRYLLKAERRDLHHTKDHQKFFSNIKAAGYVSVGDIGTTNELLITSFDNAYNYAACGTLLECVDMLYSGNIDTIATTGLASITSLNEALDAHGKRVVHAKYSARGTFGLILNALTLNRTEQQQLASSLWDGLSLTSPRTPSEPPPAEILQIGSNRR